MILDDALPTLLRSSAGAATAEPISSSANDTGSAVSVSVITEAGMPDGVLTTNNSPSFCGGDLCRSERVGSRLFVDSECGSGFSLSRIAVSVSIDSLLASEGIVDLASPPASPIPLSVDIFGTTDVRVSASIAWSKSTQTKSIIIEAPIKQHAVTDPVLPIP
jgi:hypothetical protein